MRIELIKTTTIAAPAGLWPMKRTLVFIEISFKYLNATLGETMKSLNLACLDPTNPQIIRQTISITIK